jgi:hypothetical protein
LATQVERLLFETLLRHRDDTVIIAKAI